MKIKTILQLSNLLAIPLLVLLFSTELQAQGKVSGDLELKANFYVRDPLIGASGTPQYDRQKTGGESWLNLNYSNWGFDFGLRFDFYANSNIIDPNDSYSAAGIGRWFIKKTMKKLEVTGGYMYDQIGSGILFRSYEARPQGIDNSLFGVRLKYKISKNWFAKAFMGRQKKGGKRKNFFETYKPMILGGELSGFTSVGNVQLAPGVGMLNRTIDDESMSFIVGAINASNNKFVPKYNVYAATLFNTLTYKNFSWYVEGAYKTAEAISNQNADLINTDGSVVYTTLSYSAKGLGITLQGKRTEGFKIRTSPLESEILREGFISFIPPMARQNTYRLNARYNAATQELGEYAAQIDILYSPSKKVGFLLNLSNITDLGGELLYRELFFETTLKINPRKWKLIGGVQYQEYNQVVYENKVDVPLLVAFTPYLEYVHKISRKKSLRLEAQYMFNENDLGSWAFLLAEYNIAPNWSFTFANMLNVTPRKDGKRIVKSDGNGGSKFQSPIFYPTLAMFYTNKANRYELSFVKQPEGIVCTGGICRLEPAFSGVKFGVSSRF